MINMMTSLMIYMMKIYLMTMILILFKIIAEVMILKDKNWFLTK